jgi:hypothetical protein
MGPRIGSLVAGTAVEVAGHWIGVGVRGFLRGLAGRVGWALVLAFAGVAKEASASSAYHSHPAHSKTEVQPPSSARQKHSKFRLSSDTVDHISMAKYTSDIELSPEVMVSL